MTNKTFATRLTAVVAALLFASGAWAQSTSSDVRGSVKADDGTPIAGATIVFRHEATGSTRTATSNESGSFYQAGLRVGGPYTIDVSASGHRSSKISDLYFAPGTQPPLALRLEAETSAMEEIIVTAQVMPIHDLNNGVGSSFTAEDISNMPSGTRDIISIPPATIACSCPAVIFRAARATASSPEEQNRDTVRPDTVEGQLAYSAELFAILPACSPT